MNSMKKQIKKDFNPQFLHKNKYITDQDSFDYNIYNNIDVSIKNINLDNFIESEINNHQNINNQSNNIKLKSDLGSFVSINTSIKDETKSNFYQSKDFTIICHNDIYNKNESDSIN